MALKISLKDLTASGVYGLQEGRLVRDVGPVVVIKKDAELTILDEIFILDLPPDVQTLTINVIIPSFREGPGMFSLLSSEGCKIFNLKLYGVNLNALKNLDRFPLLTRLDCRPFFPTDGWNDFDLLKRVPRNLHYLEFAFPRYSFDSSREIVNVLKSYRNAHFPYSLKKAIIWRGGAGLKITPEDLSENQRLRKIADWRRARECLLRTLFKRIVFNRIHTV